MTNLVRIFMKYKYPQSIWGDCVYDIINRNKIEQDFKHIYDVPGGAGFMSNNLRSRVCKDFTVIDIDESKVQFANKYFRSANNPTCVTGDLFKTVFEYNSLWLFVNSFYLLLNTSEFMKLNSGKINYIIGIFPYIHSKNYLHFKTKIDPHLNINEMGKDETLSFFKQQGFDLIDSEDVIKFNYLTYSNNKYFNFVLSFLFTLYEKIIRPKGSIYWVGLFVKSK